MSARHPAAPAAAAAAIVLAGNNEAAAKLVTAQRAPGAAVVAAEAPPEPQSPTHAPLAPAAFDADLQELAGDLGAKQKQIEGLLAVLPADLDAARSAQEARLRELDGAVRELEAGAGDMARRRERLLARVEDVIMSFRRV